MKKAYQSPKFKRFSAQRARREEKARKRIKKRNRGVSTPRMPRRPNMPWPLKKQLVTAPSPFSLTENSDETIQFFTKLETAFAKTPRGDSVFIDLESVDDMTPEVIVLLISKIKEEDSINKKSSRGNVPRNSFAQNMLASSGFYDFVKSRATVKRPSRGAIEKCGDNIVDSRKAAQLIEKVSERMEMSLAQEDGHQTTAVECMTNTREHASGPKREKGEKKWWFSVYCHPNNQVAQFAFVDLGIGIFKSLERQNPQWWIDFKTKLGSKRRSDILKDLLADQTVGSSLPLRNRTSTWEGHRGKGLPNIANRNRKKQTRRLRIVSNDVFADIENSEYRMLKQDFSGTVICWEHRAKRE